VARTGRIDEAVADESAEDPGEDHRAVGEHDRPAPGQVGMVLQGVVGHGCDGTHGFARETAPVELRQWTVAGALVERDGHLLLVRNVRHGGREDWSTPGGVIDADDATVLAGLAREVEEETGLRVREWDGVCYEVIAHAPDLGWRMRCEVHRVASFEGDLTIADPDGIVVEAEFCEPAVATERLAGCPQWVREPLSEWLADTWSGTNDGLHRRYVYEISGSTLSQLRVTRS
jgi:8-oxo-dGTP pyrophosphatase MutT (NUDIX family)